jgi:CubicO group peptidase (beta-lactamase class C family)
MRGTFEYSNEGAHVAAAILQQAVGTSVLEYARSRLFGPLGIDTDPAFTPAVGNGAPVARDVRAYLAAGFPWPTDPPGLAARTRRTGTSGGSVGPTARRRTGFRGTAAS